MSRIPPIKHKCVGCGHEEWLVLHECACYDICTCGEPRCKKCNHITVPKKHWEDEILSFIKGDLAQIYEWDDNFNRVDCYLNNIIDSVYEQLDKLNSK